METPSVAAPTVPKALLWRCWFTFMFLHMTCQTFDRGYTNAFTAAMAPILRHLYKGRPDADEQVREGLRRTRTYYLCEQSFSGIAFSIIVGMEEKKAQGLPVAGPAIVATRTSIIGPMSGLGDTLHGSTSRQLAIALTIPFCLAGHWAGAVSMLILLNVAPFLTAFLGVPRGYSQGGSFVLKLVKSGVLQRVSVAVGVAVMFVMGGTAAQFLDIRLALPEVQSVLDGLLPGVLSIAVVFGYFALVAKKLGRNTLTAGTLVFGVLLSSFGVMG